MITSRVEYLGGLRTECTHVKSNSKVITDAPVDNNGKGDSFSPTDLVATAYASCMITIVGIYCDKNDIEFKACTAEVVKHMKSGPRSIGKLDIEIDFTGNNWSSDEKARIITAAENCPVAKTISDDVEINFNYKF